VRNGANRVAAVVHIGHRNEQTHVVTQHAPPTDFGFEFGVERQWNLERSGKLTHPVSANIVSRVSVLRAGVAQARNQLQYSRHWRSAMLALGGFIRGIIC
jgi:hypothetical protein